MLSTLGSRLSSRPRRTLLAALVFIVIAGVVGGPLAGSLQASHAMTVKTHVARLFAKLGARDRAQLVVIAYTGLVSPAPRGR